MSKEKAKETVKKDTAKTTKVKTEKVEDVVEAIEVEEEKETTPQETKRKKAIEIDLHEYIPVWSVTNGGLNYISRKTNNIYRWQNYGDVEYIEFGELITMKSSKPKYLNTPRIIIDDAEVVEKLGLSKLYENMFNIDELDDFFRLSASKMEEKLNNMPEGFKSLIKDEAVKKIKDGSLYDLRKIKLLEKKVHVDLQIIMD